MAKVFGNGEKQNHHLRRMLEEGLHSDTKIVACDGEEIKCHKFILTDESVVFNAMFKESSESKESLTGVIHMDDMCSRSVKAFLAFLYFDDIKRADEDSGIALDLLEASHKYHIPNLEELMKKIFLGKPDKWFDVEVAMNLYFLVRNIENSEELKKKALEVMKLNQSVLNDSPGYIQLFKDEQTAARELCADLIAYQPTVGRQRNCPSCGNYFRY